MAKRQGFTAAEFLIIITIIGLISLISVPLFANYQKTTKLKSEARLLATNLRLTQQLAITEQNIYHLKIFTTTKNYQIINTKTNQIIKDITLDTEVSFNQITNLTNNTVEYNPTGGVLETGSIVLTNSKNEIVTLQVKPSGYIDVIE